MDISPVIFNSDPNFDELGLQWEHRLRGIVAPTESRMGGTDSNTSCRGALGAQLLLPLQFEWEEPIQTPPAEVLWERYGCSGIIDSKQPLLPLRFEWEEPIQTCRSAVATMGASIESNRCSHCSLSGRNQFKHLLQRCSGSAVAAVGASIESVRCSHCNLSWRN